MSDKNEWLAPPKGAVPLWRLLFAHPDISESITGAVESLSTSTDPVMVNVADAESIQVNTPDMAVQIDEQGAIVFRRYRDEDEDGRIVEREEPEDILRPWDPAADRIITMAWAAGMNAFWHLIVSGDLRLEGRHPSVLSPGRPIPIDALRGPGSDDIPFEWWPKCRPDYAAGSLQLLSGDRVWGVHIVATQQSARKAAVGISGPEEVLRKALAKAISDSPDVKTITREQVIVHAVNDLGLSENAGERVWKRVVNGISDRRLYAIWSKRGPVMGGITPLVLTPR